MKIMITGANGLLGQPLVKMLMEKGQLVVATGKSASRLPGAGSDCYSYYSADITDGQALNAIMEKERPELVVHAAAMTQVDECEVQQDRCFAVNVLGTANIIAAAEKFSRHLIYISTDFVFSGEKGGYLEEDERRPVNGYGLTKLQAEDKTMLCGIPWTIVRTGLVYGQSSAGARSNIIGWVKDHLEKGRMIKVVSDQMRTPTFVNDLARGILLIAKKSAEGIFHIAGKDILTPYDLAMQTADLLGRTRGWWRKWTLLLFLSQAGGRSGPTW